MLDPKIGLFASLPIFHGLSKEQLGSIADVTTKYFFEPGDKLITRHRLGDMAFLILTGTAKCVDFPGSPHAAERIGSGALVGEMAMLVETVHAITIQAAERLRALGIHRVALLRAMEKDPVIARQISDNLLIRLRGLARDLRRFDTLLAQIEKADLSARKSNVPSSAIQTLAKPWPMAQLVTQKTRKLG